MTIKDFIKGLNEFDVELIEEGRRASTGTAVGVVKIAGNCYAARLTEYGLDFGRPTSLGRARKTVRDWIKG